MELKRFSLYSYTQISFPAIPTLGFGDCLYDSTPYGAVVAMATVGLLAVSANADNTIVDTTYTTNTTLATADWYGSGTRTWTIPTGVTVTGYTRFFIADSSVFTIAGGGTIMLFGNSYCGLCLGFLNL